MRPAPQMVVVRVVLLLAAAAPVAEPSCMRAQDLSAPLRPSVLAVPSAAAAVTALQAREGGVTDKPAAADACRLSFFGSTTRCCRPFEVVSVSVLLCASTPTVIHGKQLCGRMTRG